MLYRSAVARWWWGGSNAVQERCGSVVEFLTGDQEAAGSSLTGAIALWSLSKTH